MKFKLGDRLLYQNGTRCVILVHGKSELMQQVNRDGAVFVKEGILHEISGIQVNDVWGNNIYEDT